MSLGAEVRLSRSSRKHIGSVDPYALKIPAPKGAEYSLTESDPSPFHAEPEQSEQQWIEFQAPEYLRNIIRIITESGLRVYKELMPMKKEQVDLENAVVWIPDSKTPNGIAEVPLTDLAREAFREQIRIAGPGTWLFPSEENPTGHIRRHSRRSGTPRCDGPKWRISGSTTCGLPTQLA